MLRSSELQRAREAMETTLTDRCSIESEGSGWQGPADSVLATDVPVRLARSGLAPQLNSEGDRIDPNASAIASVPFDQPVAAGDILVFPDDSRYRVAGVYPNSPEFRFLKRLAVEWA